MILCTLIPTKYNKYWVTFENWLVDGRICANEYMYCLFEYFNQELSENFDSVADNEKII